ncbi:MAG: outer membrane protein assembly factor BamD [Bacteroidota bacterium]|nr:outer membrane protein assembly factor BamD [Bacteroidota bacterium]
MKHILSTALLLTFALIFLSCSRVSEEELWKSSEKLLQEQKYAEAIEKLKEIVKEYPKGEKAAEAQFLIAALYNNDLHDFEKAITQYKKFVELFPDDLQVPKAMFLIGFVYNNQLHNFDSAKIAYEAFLEKFPHHELAPSAQMEIQTLGKSPEELIQPEVAMKPETKETKKKK